MWAKVWFLSARRFSWDVSRKLVVGHVIHQDTDPGAVRFYTKRSASRFVVALRQLFFPCRRAFCVSLCYRNRAHGNSCALHSAVNAVLYACDIRVKCSAQHLVLGKKKKSTLKIWLLRKIANMEPGFQHIACGICGLDGNQRSWVGWAGSCHTLWVCP